MNAEPAKLGADDRWTAVIVAIFSLEGDPRIQSSVEQIN